MYAGPVDVWQGSWGHAEVSSSNSPFLTRREGSVDSPASSVDPISIRSENGWRAAIERWVPPRSSRPNRLVC
jgi:hypothetical protein